MVFFFFSHYLQMLLHYHLIYNVSEKKPHIILVFVSWYLILKKFPLFAFKIFLFTTIFEQWDMLWLNIVYVSYTSDL